MQDSADLNALKEIIESGAISTLPTSELERYSAVLCRSQAYTFFSERQFPQICETIRLSLLRSHIADLNEKNAFTQKVVIVLTVASLLGTGVQTWLSARSQTQSVESVLQKQEVKSPNSAETSPTSVQLTPKGKP